jgi:predicted  nucleic acid-binding Zn-ribbon protein
MISPLAALLRIHEIRVSDANSSDDHHDHSEIPRLLQAINPALNMRYSKSYHRHGLSAVVAMERGICTGCHMRQPACTPVIETDIYECQNCNRLLYDPDVAYEYSVG